MKHLQTNWGPWLVLCLFLGLAICFHPFLITSIFEPIAVLIWAAWRIVSGVHQNIYWTILILICTILLLRLIPFRTNASTSAYREERPAVNRVEDWLTLFQNASVGREGTEYLRNGLKTLLMSIHQLEHFRSMKPDEAAMLEPTLLPLAVRRFIFPEMRKYKLFSRDYRSSLLFLTPRWLRRRVSNFLQIENTAIEETLSWMESVMEISNDQ